MCMNNHKSSKQIIGSTYPVAQRVVVVVIHEQIAIAFLETQIHPDLPGQNEDKGKKK